MRLRFREASYVPKELGRRQIKQRMNSSMATRWMVLTLVHVSIPFWLKASYYQTVCMPTGFQSAARSRADIVVFDAENVVMTKDKLMASDRVMRCLGTKNSDWFLINGFGIPWWADDIAALATSLVGRVTLVMVESVDHVTEIATRLPNVPIVILVGTACGLDCSAHHRDRRRSRASFDSLLISTISAVKTVSGKT